VEPYTAQPKEKEIVKRKRSDNVVKTLRKGEFVVATGFALVWERREGWKNNPAGKLPSLPLQKGEIISFLPLGL